MMSSRLNGFGFLAGQPHPDPHRKTLLFIHGAAQNSLFWKHQVSGLASHFNTVALDLPGHHQSKGPLCTTVEAMASAVLEFVDAAGLSSVVPCGLSMGGGIVLRLLLDHPSRFPEAILANTGARLKVLPDILEAARTNYDAYQKALFHFVVPEPHRTPALQAALGTATEPDNAPAVADLSACDSFDVMHMLTEIQSRVLVLAAEKDISTPLKYGQLLSDKIPDASLRIIQGCGHFSPMESPEEFNNHISAFF
ncbi:alpha/beta fold hydrolase [Desulfoluna spongiiphila]|uniref:Pimeloyl-ACP methyl ester carboxylesterase n=1 Tax=Desulfoluna spongiiphila TaxID=419481 RepID=A0A1G5G8A0_9BACT|nr:alpha/beta fold hydrolase [Desulfoluna spongiiphila]SCY47782.1 Pimeloyl-ACP methyl ester carboxylesterase [Desulfoluna spongiiphila]VVS93717.1 alpha/beta hydrolase fold [Desulfoluna spongiiphila]